MMQWLKAEDGWERVNKEGAPPPIGGAPDKIDWEYLDTPKKRGTVWGILLLDGLTGNFDRHGRNMMKHKDLGLAPIDSGFAGFYKEFVTMNENTGDIRPLDFTMQKSPLGNDWLDFIGLSEKLQSGELTKEGLQEELGDYFDDHMDSAVIEEIATACKANIKGNINDYDGEIARANFIKEGLLLAGVQSADGAYVRRDKV
jgi:hypothetical protein